VNPDDASRRGEAALRWAGGWFFLVMTAALLSAVVWFDVTWSPLELLLPVLALHQFARAWQKGLPPWRRPQDFRRLRRDSAAWFGARRGAGVTDARVYVSVGIGVLAFMLFVLAAITASGVALAAQVITGNVTPLALIWFAVLAYGWYVCLAMWPQRVAVHSDGTIEFRALVRTYCRHASDLRSVRVIGWGDNPQTMVFNFGVNDVRVAPVPIDYSDLLARCQRANPQISVDRSWHA